jgi:hypothetical protein
MLFDGAQSELVLGAYESLIERGESHPNVSQAELCAPLPSDPDTNWTRRGCEQKFHLIAEYLSDSLD